MRDYLEMAVASAKLALKGELVQDFPLVAAKVAGAGAAGALIGVATVAAGAPLWIGTLVGGGVGGFLTPLLLKDVKIA